MGSKDEKAGNTLQPPSTVRLPSCISDRQPTPQPLAATRMVKVSYLFGCKPYLGLGYSPNIRQVAESSITG